MSDDKSEPRFDSSAEQIGGSYDQGTAESRALVHAQKKFGRRWFRKLPLIWATESSHYNEDVDRWEIVVSCHPLRDEKNRGEWVYHISPDGRKVLPGTPLLRSQLRLGRIWILTTWLFGSLAVVATLTVAVVVAVILDSVFDSGSTALFGSLAMAAVLTVAVVVAAILDNVFDSRSTPEPTSTPTPSPGGAIASTPAVRPTLGRIRLTQLRPEHLQCLYTDKLSSGLGQRSIHYIHATLHTALRDKGCNRR